jgi:hypothetical protein
MGSNVLCSKRRAQYTETERLMESEVENLFFGVCGSSSCANSHFSCTESDSTVDVDCSSSDMDVDTQYQETQQFLTPPPLLQKAGETLTKDRQAKS